MAYTRTNWANREVEFPRRYDQVTNADGTVTLTPAEGEIFTEGTPIVAENMNNMEDQLVITDSHISDLTNPHSVTAAQIDTYTKAEADGRFEPIDSSYTKAEADSRFHPYQPKREGVLQYTSVNGSYTANNWENIWFEEELNKTDNIVNNFNNLEILKSGYYSVHVALSLGNIASSTGFALTRVNLGGEIFRLGGQHFTQNGNLCISGSLIEYISAGAIVRAWAYCSADFDILTGTSTDLRSYLSIRELIY